MKRVNIMRAVHWKKVLCYQAACGVEVMTWLSSYQSDGACYFQQLPVWRRSKWHIRVEKVYFSHERDAIVFALKWGSR